MLDNNEVIETLIRQNQCQAELIERLCSLLEKQNQLFTLITEMEQKKKKQSLWQFIIILIIYMVLILSINMSFTNSDSKGLNISSSHSIFEMYISDTSKVDKYHWIITQKKKNIKCEVV